MNHRTATYRKLVLPFFAIALLVLIIACSDDPTEPPVPGNVEGTLLTLELGEYFVHAFTSEGIVFVSDIQGEVLDVASWSGVSTVVLSTSDARPDSVSFTLVGYKSGRLSLSTEIGIPVGTLVSFDAGYAHNPTGEAELFFANAPVCDYHMVSSSLFSERRPEQLPVSVTIPVHWDDVDVFVRVDPVDGWPLGGWYPALRAGESLTMDFASSGALMPMIRHAVKTPSMGDRLTAALSRDTRAGLARSVVGFAHDNYYGQDIPDSVIMYGPMVELADQTSFFHWVKEGDPDVFFTLDVRGEVPAEFTEPPGDLSIVSAVPDSAVFSMTGSWDRFAASWNGSGDFRSVSWYIEGRAPLRSYSLPRLPQEILELEPNLVREDFWQRYLVVEDDAQDGVVYSKGFYMPSPESSATTKVDRLPERGMPRRLRK